MAANEDSRRVSEQVELEAEDDWDRALPDEDGELYYLLRCVKIPDGTYTQKVRSFKNEAAIQEFEKGLDRRDLGLASSGLPEPTVLLIQSSSHRPKNIRYYVRRKKRLPLRIFRERGEAWFRLLDVQGNNLHGNGYLTFHRKWFRKYPQINILGWHVAPEDTTQLPLRLHPKVDGAYSAENMRWSSQNGIQYQLFTPLRCY